MLNKIKSMRFPVGIKFSVAVLIVLVLQNSILLYAESKRIRTGLLQQIERELQLNLSGLQLTLGFLLKRNELSQIQQEVTTLGTNPAIKEAFLVNDLDTIIASIHVAALGHDINSILAEDAKVFLAEFLPKIPITFKTYHLHDENRKIIYSITPINMGVLQNNSLRHPKIAYLFLARDISWIDASTSAALYKNSLPLITTMGLTLVILILLFELIINQRLRKLTQATKSFSFGDPLSLPLLNGNDEITDLKLSLELMLEKLAQQHFTLQNSETQLQRSQQLARVGTWEYNLETNTLNWSDETFRIFGLVPQSIQPSYESFLQMTHPDDRTKVNDAYSRSLERNLDGYEISHRILKADNSEIRHLIERCDHQRDKSGKIIRSIGMVHDITELVQADLVLRKSEAKFRGIIDASPVPLAVNDGKQNIIYLNPAFTSTFGYVLADIPTLVEWWPKAYPDLNYRNWVARTWQEHLDVAASSNLPFAPMELSIRCKNGSHKTILAEACAISDADENQHLVVLYDISDILKAKQDLSNSSALLDNVLNTSPEFIFVKDKQLRTILCNHAFASALGKSRESLYGKTDIENGWNSELVNGNPEKNIRGFVQDDLDALSGKDVHNPFDRANVNGEVRIFDTIKKPLRDSSNNIIGVLGIARDMTDRYASIEALLSSEERLRLATEAAEIGVWEWNLTDNTVRWDKQMFTIYGIEPTHNGFIDYQDWRNAVLPSELSTQEAILHNTVATQGRSTREFKIRRRYDNAIRLIQAAETVRLTATGDVEWLIGINRDLTDIKNAENKLRMQKEEQQLILNSMIDAVITIDDTGIVHTYNKAAALIFGFTEAEVLGNNIKMLMPPATAQHHDGYIKNYIDSNIGNIIGTGREVIARRKSGEDFPMHLAIASLPPGADGKIFFVGSCVDLTNIKNQEEQLRRSQKMDALGKLTGGIAHDFNNMLGVILGYSELLKSPLSHDPKHSKYIDEIYHAGERAKRLTSKLLAFSRKTAATTEVVNINQLLIDSQHLLEKTLTARIGLILNLSPTIWPVLLDKSMLEDAILNMSINAMHAMPAGGRFVISTQNTALKSTPVNSDNPLFGDYVLLTLTDNGIGMGEETRQKIFDPFFSTKGDKGTGLGMSQVYGFVQQSSGAITVQSSLGHGTTLSLYFPRHNKLNAASTEASNALSTFKPGKGTVLIVDDEPSLLLLTNEILTAAGYNVLSAASARVALGLLETEKVDVLFSDIVMPGMNGFELAENVQTLYPHVRIQLTSGYSEAPIQVRYLEWHSTRLAKPYTAASLLKAIEAILE